MLITPDNSNVFTSRPQTIDPGVLGNFWRSKNFGKSTVQRIPQRKNSPLNRSFDWSRCFRPLGDVLVKFSKFELGFSLFHNCGSAEKSQRSRKPQKLYILLQVYTIESAHPHFGEL